MNSNTAIEALTITSLLCYSTALLTLSMKKEVLLAIIIGFTIGLIITFGIYTARKALNQHQSITPTPSPQISPSPSSSQTLTLTEPENETVSDQEKITLAGTTNPQSLVTIFTQEDEIIVYANDQGKFSTPITLVGGANDITVTSISPAGPTAQTRLTLVYSTVKI